MPKKSGTKRFHAIHSHGFVRVAACTPAVRVGDPGFNAAETLRLAHEGDVESCDLMLFPELGLSAYAIDDLFLQDALLARVEAEIADLAKASEKLAPVLIVGLIVGVGIGLLQALTQIQEATLVAAPKIVAIFVSLLIFLPLMGSLMSGFMRHIAARIAGL